MRKRKKKGDGTKNWGKGGEERMENDILEYSRLKNKDKNF